MLLLLCGTLLQLADGASAVCRSARGTRQCRRHHEGDDGHELDEDVESWSTGVFARVSHRVSHHRSLYTQAFRASAHRQHLLWPRYDMPESGEICDTTALRPTPRSLAPAFDIRLAVVPGAARVAHQGPKTFDPNPKPWHYGSPYGNRCPCPRERRPR